MYRSKSFALVSIWGFPIPFRTAKIERFGCLMLASQANQLCMNVLLIEKRTSPYITCIRYRMCVINTPETFPKKGKTIYWRADDNVDDDELRHVAVIFRIMVSH